MRTTMTASSSSTHFPLRSSSRVWLVVFFFLILSSSTCLTAKANELNDQKAPPSSRCDESKCRTLNPDLVPGYWWMPPPPEDFSGGYTCWVPFVPAVHEGGAATDSTSDGTLLATYPCAEGYVGRIVPNVTRLEEDGTTVSSWYTCCPLLEEEEEQQDELVEAQEEDIVQTCSDAYYDPVTFSGWAVPDGLAPRNCISDEYPFPRDTGAIIPMDHGGKVYDVRQFLCCKTTDENEPTDPLDQDGDLLVDSCSPSACTSLDSVGGVGDCFADGVTEPFTCNTKDESNPFVYPTLNGHDDLNDYNFHYVCCKDKHDHPYQDANEWDGLQVALMIQSMLSLITFFVSSVFTLGILTNTKVRSQAWNLYLVMVSIPDVIYNLFRFIYGLVVITRSNTFIQTTWTIDWFYAVANLLLNAVIVYEVHKFLRAFKRTVRIPPPSIKGVLIQSFVVYVIAAGCGLWMFYLHTEGIAIAGFAYDQFLRFHKISLCCMVIPAILFVTLICLDVWYRQLLPTHVGRTRTLALYFLRVILVFIVTWVPYLILITIGLQSSRVLGYIGMCISSTQGTLSVAVAMSKSDVQWAVLSFLRGRCNDEPPKEGEGKRREVTRSRDSTRGSVRISGLNLAAAEAASSHYRSTDTMGRNSQDTLGGQSQPLGTSSIDDCDICSDDDDDDNLVGGSDSDNRVGYLEEDTDRTYGVELSDRSNEDLETKTTPPPESQEHERAPNMASKLVSSVKGRIDMTGAVVDYSSEETEREDEGDKNIV